jgi:predicted SprT family Zn-dependent metalloprotease
MIILLGQRNFVILKVVMFSLCHFMFFSGNLFCSPKKTRFKTLMSAVKEGLNKYFFTKKFLKKTGRGSGKTWTFLYF